MALATQKRIRSPNYPSLSLKEAVDKVRGLQDQNAQHAMTRETAAKGMGYNGLSGTSATAISALNKYGLLEGRGDEIRVADRAMSILYPHSDDERLQALHAAALEPALFRELSGKFPGTIPSDELLKSYLVRNKFAPAAASQVISVYKETLEFAGITQPNFDTAPSSIVAEAPRTQNQRTIPSIQAGPPTPILHSQPNLISDERQIGVNDLEGGAYVKIVASRDVSTEEALEWAEDIIARKRRELEKLMKRGAIESPSVTHAEKNSDDSEILS